MEIQLYRKDIPVIYVLQAFGVPSASPLEVSIELENLNISNSIHGVSNRTTVHKPTVKHIATRQPYWVTIVNRVSLLRRPLPDRTQVLFICDAYAKLQTCNVKILPFTNLRESLINALSSAVDTPVKNGWSLIEREPSIEDYVNIATKPSYLNLVQSEFYRIVPYDLRKKVQIAIIGYLASVTSRSKLMELLNSNFKLEKVRILLKNPKAVELRNAVATYIDNHDIELTSKITGFETFEILYIFNSAKKSIESSQNKVSKGR